MTDLLDQLGRETEPTDAEVARARARLDPAHVSRGLLAHLPLEASPSEVAVVRARLRERRRARHPFGWGLVLVPVAVAAAALVLLWPRGSDPLPWLPPTGSVGPGDGVAVAPPGAPLDAVLGESTPYRSDRMALAPAGEGRLAGTPEAPQVAWQQGTLQVEVTPERGTAFELTTREARVRVIGTAFEVTRDPLGTRVDVSRGKVEVTCLAGGVHVLGAAQTVTCWPLAAPGLLGRAQALEAAGAPAADVLATVEVALPTATGPFRDELSALRAEQLAALGRHAEALAEARTFLGRVPGGDRRTEVLAIAAAAALASEGCAGARPFLEDLEAAGAGDPDLLVRCEGAR